MWPVPRKLLPSTYSSCDLFNRLAEEFYEAVRASGRFNWIGLLQTADEIGRTRVGVYLLDAERKPSTQSDRVRSDLDLSYLFDKLSLAARPQLPLDLYYIDGGRCSPEEAERRLRDARAADEEHRELLWSEVINSAPFPGVCVGSADGQRAPVLGDGSAVDGDVV